MVRPGGVARLSRPQGQASHFFPIFQFPLIFPVFVADFSTCLPIRPPPPASPLATTLALHPLANKVNHRLIIIIINYQEFYLGFILEVAPM